MSFYPYVVCWDAVHFNVVEIEENFKAAGQELTIINSGDLKKDHWMNVGDIRYYRQLRLALESFDKSYDYMAFICGDVSSDKWNFVLKRATEVLNNYNVGIYAPHLTNEPWSKDSCYLETVAEDLFLSCQTDGIMVFIKNDIVSLLIDYFNFLETKTSIPELKSGWGMDVIWCTLSMYLNKPILRDNKFIVNHPAGSSYDHGRASEELKIILDAFNEFASDIDFDLNKIQGIESSIYKRMSRDPEFMNKDKFYTNLLLKKEKHDYNYHIVSIDDSRAINKKNLEEKLMGKKIEISVLNARVEGNKEKFFEDNPKVRITWDALKKGEIGCFGSHYLAWKYLKNSDLDNLVVFEDDIIVYDNFQDQYDNLINNAPKGWDIISIYVDENQYPRYNDSQEINSYISKGYQDWSTLGYVISKSGANKICKYVEDHGMNQPVDWYIFRNGHKGVFNVYTLPPHSKVPLAIDKSHPSLVQE